MSCVLGSDYYELYPMNRWPSLITQHSTHEPPNTIATDGWKQHGGSMVAFI